MVRPESFEMIKINKFSGLQSMEYVFIGNPCREEIELHLKNKRYSLLNNTKLRSDIINRRINGTDAGLCEGPDISSKPYTETTELPLDSKETGSSQKTRSVHGIVENLVVSRKSGGLLTKRTSISENCVSDTGDSVVGQCGGSRAGIELEFEFLKNRTTRQEEGLGLENGTVENVESSESSMENNRHPERMRRKASVISQGSSKKKGVLGEKSINTLHVRSTAPKPKCKGRTNGENQRLVSKNTLMNSGYRFVRLSFKDKEFFLGEEGARDISIDRRHERRVRFANSPSTTIHNAGAPQSILQAPSKPRKIPMIRLKETIPVESLGCSEGSVFDEEFEFRYTK